MGILNRLFGRRQAAPASPRARGLDVGGGRRPGAMPETEPEREQRGRSEAADFLSGEFLFLTTPSGQVVGGQYFADTQTLQVEYSSGEGWAYDPVSPAQAEEFVTATHKMEWIWSNIRVRGPGNKHSHQVNARRVR